MNLTLYFLSQILRDLVRLESPPVGMKIVRESLINFLVLHLEWAGLVKPFKPFFTEFYSRYELQIPITYGIMRSPYFFINILWETPWVLYNLVQLALKDIWGSHWDIRINFSRVFSERISARIHSHFTLFFPSETNWSFSVLQFMGSLWFLPFCANWLFRCVANWWYHRTIHHRVMQSRKRVSSQEIIASISWSSRNPVFGGISFSQKNSAFIFVIR